MISVNTNSLLAFNNVNNQPTGQNQQPQAQVQAQAQSTQTQQAAPAPEENSGSNSFQGQQLTYGSDGSASSESRGSAIDIVV